MVISKEDLQVLLSSAGWQCSECYANSCKDCELAKVLDKFKNEREEMDE